MAKYIDADKLIAKIERHINHYESSNRDDFKNGELYICQELLSFIKSLQQKQSSLSSNLDEAANKFAVLYDQGTCDGIAQECFKAGAQWMKEQMMNDAVKGTLAGQLLSSLTENGKQMVITVPRDKFPSNPKTKSIKLIIVKEN